MTISPIHVRLFSLIVPAFQSFPYLSEERLINIINVMTAHPDETFRSGRIEGWAAAVVYLARNYENESSLQRPSYEKALISDHFKIATSTLTDKSNYIRRLMRRSSG